MQCCKPVSRILSGRYHLSGSGIAAGIYLPTLPHISAKGNFAGPAKDGDIHGISAHKVYPLYMLPYTIVSPYLTFSPLSRFWRDGYFLWHFLHAQRRDRLLTGVLPCAVRTFLVVITIVKQRDSMVLQLMQK